MVKKIKSSSCGPSWCQNHLFELNPIKSGLHFKKKLRLRLCPKHNKGYNTFDKVLPVLNRDKKHYTPLFILEEDKHDERALATHEKLIEKQQEDQSYWSIYEPKHGGQKAYCSVCEKTYSDYMEHIQSHDHKKNLQNTIFTRYIMQIQQKFKSQSNRPNTSLMPSQQITATCLTLPDVTKGDTVHQKLIQEDLETIKSIKLTHKPTNSLDKLQMEQIESQYVDTSTLKELEELI